MAWMPDSLRLRADFFAVTNRDFGLETGSECGFSGFAQRKPAVDERGAV
jgi:hypothetical protein